MKKINDTQKYTVLEISTNISIFAINVTNAQIQIITQGKQNKSNKQKTRYLLLIKKKMQRKSTESKRLANYNQNKNW